MECQNDAERKKLASLMSTLRSAVQLLLDLEHVPAPVHMLAAGIEILEDMFHVELTPPPPPTNGNGPRFWEILESDLPPLPIPNQPPALSQAMFKRALAATKPAPKARVFRKRGRRPVRRTGRRKHRN